MILRKLVREKILEYFGSEEWNSAMEVLSRGRVAVRHAHIYADSILHPLDVTRLVHAYFEARGLPIERKIKLLSHGTGYTNVYYIQPKGMCHFEIFLRFTPETVLEPMPAAAARGGKSFEYWDPEYMEAYYRKFDFEPMGDAERKEVQQYFRSDDWKRIYAVMAYENERNVHSHCIVETRLHPEEILPIGQEAIEARGWKVDRGVSVVFGVNGMDQGKITYLVEKPEIVLELEWEFNPDVTIKPAVVPLARVTTTDMVARDTAGVPYLRLNEDDFAWFAANCSESGLARKLAAE